MVVAAETTAAKQNRPQTRRRGRRGSLTALVFIAATALAAVANIHLAQGNALDGIRVSESARQEIRTQLPDALKNAALFCSFFSYALQAKQSF